MISPGQNGEASDFIDKSEQDATPANDAGRVPKLEADGRLHSDFAIPAGVYFPFAGASGDIPAGFLLCDGSAVSRTTYADLFAAIGTLWGSGNGTTTFNVPNLKGRIPVGYDASQTEFDTVGELGGEKTHLLTSAESGVPAHPHPLQLRGDGDAGSGAYNAESNDSSLSSAYNTGNNTPQDASQAHNNLQPFGVSHYIIKY